jgi:hypothetical protein
VFSGTRQTYFFEESRQTYLLSVREKVLDKKGFADVLFAEPSLPSATLSKAFAECFWGFADVLFAEPSLPSATLRKAFAECF